MPARALMRYRKFLPSQFLSSHAPRSARLDGRRRPPPHIPCPYSHLLACLLWTARVVLGRVYMLVIFYRLQVGDDFGRLAQCNRQALF